MAPRDDDKAMAGMLRRTLARSQSGAASSAEDCPPAEILAAYYERSLGEDESSRYELHFSQCARCREQLAALVRAEEAPQPRATWAWLWNPYFLAPAVAVLALAVFFGVHRSSRTATTNQPQNAPLVAMSRADQPSAQNEAAPKPTAPIEESRNAPSRQLQIAPSDAAERDSIAKTKQMETPAAPPRALADKKEMPVIGGNVDELQKSVGAAGASQPTAPSENGNLRANAISSAPAAQGAVAPSAPAPAAPPARAFGGAVSRSTDATAEAVNKDQANAPEAMHRYEAAAKSQPQQMTAEISAQKVFQAPNTKVLWRSADGGFVERSADGGATWEGQPLSGMTGEINAGSSPTPKICWLVGSGGTIFMTKDAVNWTKIAPPVTTDFSAVTAKDASNATITAADGRQFQTTDGGKHWKPLP